MQATILKLTDEVVQRRRRGGRADVADMADWRTGGLAEMADLLREVAGVKVEAVIGRTLAYCLHPAAAWSVVSARSRAAIVGAYAAAGYAAVLAALLLR